MRPVVCWGASLAHSSPVVAPACREQRGLCCSVCSVTGLHWSAALCCAAAGLLPVALRGSSASCPRGGAPSVCAALPACTPTTACGPFGLRGQQTQLVGLAACSQRPQPCAASQCCASCPFLRAELPARGSRRRLRSCAEPSRGSALLMCCSHVPPGEVGPPHSSVVLGWRGEEGARCGCPPPCLLQTACFVPQWFLPNKWCFFFTAL